MGDQFIAKAILVVVLVGLMAVLVVPRRGARPLAIRRLTYVALLAAAVAAVVYPAWLTWVAETVGVGRGADLLLYGLILVFISHSIASKSRHAADDRRFTELARAVAIERAEPAEQAGERLVNSATGESEG